MLGAALGSAFLIGWTIWFVEVFFKLSVYARCKALLSVVLASANAVARDGVSDYSKERALKVYLYRLGKSIAYILFCFFILFLPLILLCVTTVWLGSNIVDKWVELGIFGFFGLAIQVLVAFGWVYLRSRLPVVKSQPDDQGADDYTDAQKFLHALALGNSAVYKALTALSFRSTKSTQTQVGSASLGFNDDANQSPVFIAGLARSGSTVLMRELYSTGQFSSLTYADMPFVYAPGFWRKLHKSFGSGMSAIKKERAHGDGLMVGFDSPEAFDEVFWRIALGHKYIKIDRLVSVEVSDSLIEKFRGYVTSIVRTGPPDAQRYLSKNNNNLLRLKSLYRAFPTATVIVPFRNPVDQALSLFEQHRRFSRSQSTNRFSMDYMNWLGHHEFGLNHKPFFWQKLARQNDWGLANPNYWLAMWLETYSFVIDAGSPVLWVCYESLCEHSIEELNRIFKQIGSTLAIAKASELRITRKDTDGGVFDAELLSRSQALYQRLQQLAK